MGSESSLLFQSIPALLQGLVITLQIALVAMTIGLGGGIIVGVIGCNKLRTNFSAAVLSAFVWIIRGTPLFVQVLVIYYALPEISGISMSPFTAGVTALGINSTAYISEIIRAGINAIPEGQWDAGFVTGLTPWKTLQGIILPQAMRAILPSITNELTALIKETSILMVIGVAELTKTGRDIVVRELDPMTIYLATAALYLVLTTTVSFVAQCMQPKGGAG